MRIITDIGLQIAALRRKRNLSQQDLAKRAFGSGGNQSTICRLETGFEGVAYTMSLERLCYVLDALDAKIVIEQRSNDDEH